MSWQWNEIFWLRWSWKQKTVCLLEGRSNFSELILCESESRSVGLTLFDSMDCRVGSLSLLHWIFPTQESNQGLCIAGGFFANWAFREAHIFLHSELYLSPTFLCGELYLSPKPPTMIVLIRHARERKGRAFVQAPGDPKWARAGLQRAQPWSPASCVSSFPAQLVHLSDLRPASSAL